MFDLFEDMEELYEGYMRDDVDCFCNERNLELNDEDPDVYNKAFKIIMLIENHKHRQRVKQRKCLKQNIFLLKKYFDKVYP